VPPTFLPGLRLCRLFYLEAVRPLLDSAYPGLPHAAARVGPGSEVLGFDTERSVDHDWGPRLELFLTTDNVTRYGEELSALLAERLPKRIHGWPTNFEPADACVRVMTPTTGPVAHRVQLADVATWSIGQLGVDARDGLTDLDWLAIPAQRLAEATGGAVFHDDLGELTDLRARLNWYPDTVWRYVLAAQWTRIAQEEAFVGRTAEAGDDLGSRLIAARLAREVMRLCLLLDRRHPPYAKWLGTAFAALSGSAAPGSVAPGIAAPGSAAPPEASSIAGALRDAVDARDPVRRQDALCTAYEAAGRWQNQLKLAHPVDPTRRPYFDRPYPVIDAARFATALLDRVDGPLAAAPIVGAIDQYVDSTDVLSRPDLARALTTAVHPARTKLVRDDGFHS
jgi:hypothetical protein